jgi:hypothetical protein
MPTVKTIRKLSQDNLGETEIAQGKLCEIPVRELHFECKVHLVHPSKRVTSYAAAAFLEVMGTRDALTPTH